MVFPKPGGVARIMGRGIPTDSQSKSKYLPGGTVKKANE
jgi:hypothetical protein